MIDLTVADMFIQPMECDSFSPQKEFDENVSICYYGSGFKENQSVNLTLESQNINKTIQSETSENGILSSLFKNNSYFKNLKQGIYRLYVVLTGNTIEYGEDVIVSGDTLTEVPDKEIEPEVPEFTTIAALLFLIFAGIFVKKKRKQ
ncbi:hypothetical protein GF327_03005 [Candidatus Woesearchaeota archaeon]|nr:hypothetical protein [Candidatus Woesearchaeota archaeon]